MHGRCFGKVVVHNDADAITLIYLNSWSRRTAVVTPKIHRATWNNFLLHRFGDEMELLNVPIHAKRKVGDVWRLNKNRNAMPTIRHFAASLFHLHSPHPLRHIHLLGREHFAGGDDSRSRQDIPQKPAPAAHASSYQARMAE